MQELKDVYRKIYKSELVTASYCILAAIIVVIVITKTISVILISSILMLLLLWKFSIDRRKTLIDDFRKLIKKQNK